MGILNTSVLGLWELRQSLSPTVFPGVLKLIASGWGLPSNQTAKIISARCLWYWASKAQFKTPEGTVFSINWEEFCYRIKESSKKQAKLWIITQWKHREFNTEIRALHQEEGWHLTALKGCQAPEWAKLNIQVVKKQPGTIPEREPPAAATVMSRAHQGISERLASANRMLPFLQSISAGIPGGPVSSMSSQGAACQPARVLSDFWVMLLCRF